MATQALLGNRYILHEKLGEGGMAEVYRGTHVLLDREVAIKFINPKVIGDPSLVGRFQQEARSVARLQHPNVMQVYDFDTAEDGRYFMAMEYLPGGDLQGYLRHKRQQGKLFTLFEGIFIVKAVAEGLNYAHKIGVVHRDVKPSNIFVADETRVVIGDFGLAKMLESTLDSGGGTMTGAIIGTPAYISPEQAEGRWVDQRTDIYSLGVVLYEVLTGTPPYESENTLGLLMKHLHAPIPNPCEIRPDLPPAANTIVQRALAKDADSRYPTMSAFIKDLEDLKPIVDDQALTVIKLTPIPSTRMHPTSPPNPTAADAAQSSSSSGSGSRPSSAATISLDLTFNWWTAALVMAFVGLLAGLTILAVFLSNGQNTRQTPTANPPAVSIASAVAGDYLVVVAPMYDTTTNIDISENVTAWLLASPLRIVLEEQFRVETYPKAITTREQAQQIGTDLHAKVVIWGRMDAAGWQIYAQAPDDGLNELRLRVSVDENQAVKLSERVPVVLDVYSRVLVMDDLVNDDNLFAALYLMLKLRDIRNFDVYISLGATPFDQDILTALVGLVVGDYLASDQAITRGLAINPNAPALLYFRWAANVLSGNDDLALKDVERLADVATNESFPKGLKLVSHYLAGDLDAVQATGADFDFTISSTSLFTYSFIYQAEIQEGNFAEALEAVTTHRDWLQSQGIDDWQQNFLDALGFLYYIQGDQKALLRLLPDLKDYRSTRFYQEGNAFFREARPDAYAAITFSFGGFVEEITDQSAAARLTYRFGIALHPDDYLLNWRQGWSDSLAGDYQRAYDRYQKAIDNAPVPFPIARYEQAVLVSQHADSLTAPLTACELLADAQTLAESDAVFYAALLIRISDSIQQEGCD